MSEYIFRLFIFVCLFVSAAATESDFISSFCFAFFIILSLFSFCVCMCVCVYLVRMRGPSWGWVWVWVELLASVWLWGIETGRSSPTVRPHWDQWSPQERSPTHPHNHTHTHTQFRFVINQSVLYMNIPKSRFGLPVWTWRLTNDE